MRTPTPPTLLAASLLGVLAGALAGPPARSPLVAADEFTAPPERVAVTVGEERLVLVPGEEAALADGTPVSAAVLDTRAFDVDAPFTFEYPRGWRFSGAGGEAGAWWSLAGDGALVSVRRTSGDAAAAVDAYVRGVQGGTARDVVALERELDGVTVKGARCRAPGMSLRGGPEGDWIVEVFGFEGAAGRTWVVALHRQLAAASPAPTIELVEVEGLLEPVVHLPGERDPAADTMAALAASWRWQR